MDCKSTLRRVEAKAIQAYAVVSAVAVAGIVLSTTNAAALVGASLTFEVNSGKITSQQGPLRPWYPASLTKLMTAYVTFSALKEGRINLTSPVVVSKNALSEPPSKMGFEVGTVMTVDNALKMVIVKSANDIAVALGEAVSGNENAFVKEMNHRAQLLGMSHTRWTNPNGLPDNRQVTTARDMAFLTRALMTEFPQYAHYFEIQAIRHGKRILRSHNKLLGRVSGVNGMKTGYICNSAFNLVASARRGGTTIVTVVLGARSSLERAVVARNHIERGFSKAAKLSFGDSKLNSLAGKQTRGSLPPDGYCRTNKRPTPDQLAATYGRAGGGGSLPGVRMSFADFGTPAADAGGSAFPSTQPKTKKGKKKRRRDYLTELLGPATARTNPIQVYLGTPDNPNRTVIKQYPLPRPRPTDL